MYYYTLLYNEISKLTSGVVVFHRRFASPTYSTPPKSIHKVWLESSSTIQNVRKTYQHAMITWIKGDQCTRVLIIGSIIYSPARSMPLVHIQKYLISSDNSLPGCIWLTFPSAACPSMNLECKLLFHRHPHGGISTFLRLSPTPYRTLRRLDVTLARHEIGSV